MKGIGCLGILFVGFIGFSVYLAATAPRPAANVGADRVATVDPPRAPAAAPSEKVDPSLTVPGKEVVIEATNGGPVSLALDDDSYSKMISALGRSDKEELGILASKGKIIIVKSGSRAKVIEMATFSRKVRMRDEEHEGVEAWVSADFITPAK